MLEYLKQEANLTHTENGAVTYLSTTSDLLPTSPIAEVPTSNWADCSTTSPGNSSSNTTVVRTSSASR